MSDVVYRTSGPWGAASVDADLTANQVDTNFWILYSLILALQDAAPDTIAYFTVTGNQMWITMTDHYVFGPFTIPTAVFNFRGEWHPNVAYAVNDIFTANGAVYMCIYPQLNSGATFYALANDSIGHNYYGLLLAAAPNPLPSRLPRPLPTRPPRPCPPTSSASRNWRRPSKPNARVVRR